jgi:glucose/mannose-6-phosphate isomerase
MLLLARLDPSGMGEIIAGFPQQCRAAAEIARRSEARLPSTNPRNIIVCGMGGSAIAGDIAASWLSGRAVCPIHVHRSYGLPGWAGPEDLVIASSYSGETEETLSAFDEAVKRQTGLAGITSGGTLKSKCLARGFPLTTIPGGLPPRGALGYSFFALAGMLESSGISSGNPGEWDESMDLLQKMSEELSARIPAADNPAKRLAEQLHGCLPVVYGSSDLLAPVARRWANQLNENAKVPAYWAAMPELCHNEIVGWEKLDDIRTKAKIIILNDREDHPRIRLRFEVIQDIIKPMTSGIIALESRGAGRLARLFSLVYLADFVSYYLALMNQADPMPVKNIDQLKSVLRDRQ